MKLPFRLILSIFRRSEKEKCFGHSECYVVFLASFCIFVDFKSFQTRMNYQQGIVKPFWASWGHPGNRKNVLGVYACALEIRFTFDGSLSIYAVLLLSLMRSKNVNKYCSAKPKKQMYVSDKVNRCLARYSPLPTTTNRPTNRALNKPAWPGPN